MTARYPAGTDGVHDMGGMHGFGPVVRPGCGDAYDEEWEARVFAISTLVGIEGLGAGSGRAIREEMPPSDYLRASYYERWLWSTEQRLARKGTIELEELDAWKERLRAGEPVPNRTEPDLAAEAVRAARKNDPIAPAGPARYAIGERVRARRMRPTGHTRCPRYVRGVVGVVEAIRGTDRFPDIGPYEGPPEPVYAVAFLSDDLFGASEEGGWTVLLDLFESYLEPA